MTEPLTNMDEIVESMRGLSIVDGGTEGEHSIHLWLSDGRYLILTGVVGLYRVSGQIH